MKMQMVTLSSTRLGRVAIMGTNSDGAYVKIMRAKHPISRLFKQIIRS